MKGSTQSRSLRTFFFSSLILALAAAQAGAAQDGACDWQRGDLHKIHWPQLPDFSAGGTVVSLSQAVLADDFRCLASGPVRDIHIWASFMEDALPKAGPASLTLTLSIYSDVPGDGKTSSRPGGLLWNQTFTPGQYTVREVYDGPGNWYDPVTGAYAADNHRRAYQYNFCVHEPFMQQEGSVYWLGVSFVDADGDSSFGWKTTGRQWRWNDRAARLPQNGEEWLPLDYPREHPYAGQALDLSFVITSGDSTVAEHDLGDAPDSSNSRATTTMLAYPNGVVGDFPTVYQAGSPPYGPIHLMPRDAFYLGRWVSLENEADLGPDEDSVNNLDPATSAADRDAADDGLRLPVVMPSCQQTALDYTITATSSLAGRIYVNVWCDWNRDGDWNDTIVCPDGTRVPEWAVQDHRPFIPGIGTFALTTPAFTCWHPETAGDPDPLWVRITVSERPWSGDPAWGGSGPAEGYNYGETEDYYLQPKTEQMAVAYDWGDAPDSPEAPGYPTLAIHDGARHAIGGPWFGGHSDRPDAEADGQPEAGALGDDNADSSDENGVSVPPLIQGHPVSVTLEVNGGGGVIQGWIDFNADRDWQEEEQVVNSFFSDGIHSVSFTVPADAAIGQTFTRWRISRNGGLNPDGPASDGEVEDHAVWIRPVPFDAKWCQWPDLTPLGIDIRIDGNSVQPHVLADDFECTSQDRLTLIRLWGSWENDQQGQIRRIHVSIHPDDPAGPAGMDRENRFSKPGPETLWERVFFAGEFNETLYHITRIGGQRWWDMAAGGLVDGNAAKVWQIDLNVDPSEAFLQSGSPDKPQVLWLAVAVETTEGQFGWKTRHCPEQSANNAVADFGDRLPRSWQEMRYPEGHPCYDLETNSIDMAFCLMYTVEEAEQPTSRPGSVTQCPAVATQCPATATNCPTMPTLCPAVSTKCPVVITQCPVVATQCPPSQTACPSTATQCPAVATRCPSTTTQCPAMPTQCPAGATTCPVGITQCPAVETQCPASQTACPASVTKCPTSATQCPATTTQCPTMTTFCPATETQCPAGVTQCPAVSTRCPTTATACPAIQTQCPVVSTQCPMDLTKCPIACPSVPGPVSAVSSIPAFSGGACPAVDAQCPTVVDYLTAAAVR